MWTYMMAAARGDRSMSMINARRNRADESPSRLSRPLFSGSNQLHRIPRVIGNGSGGGGGGGGGMGGHGGAGLGVCGTGVGGSPASGLGVGGGGSPFGGAATFHNYASTAYPPPQYTTANPNRCPMNSNDKPYVTPSAEEAACELLRHQVGRQDRAGVHHRDDGSKSQLEMSAEQYAQQQQLRRQQKRSKRNNSDAVIEDGGGGGGVGRPADHNQQPLTKVAAIRRSFTTLTHRITKRSRSRPPDWILDQFVGGRGGSAGIPSDGNPTGSSVFPSDDEVPLCSSVCGRLSVDPTLPSHYRWLSLVTLAVVYNLIFVIGRSVFWEINNKSSSLWFTLDYVCDLVYLIDTLVHAHEGYLEQGLLVRDASKLRTHYMSTKSWRLDIISILPTDLVYIWWSPNRCYQVVPCSQIVRINRLLRFPRMVEWFERTETATGFPNAFRILKVVLAILVLIHWNACAYFSISYWIGFGSDNWVYNLNGTVNSTLTRQYIYSFYWSTLTLTTIGETPTPENDVEYLFVVADFLAGVLIFATIVGNIGSMISNMNVSRVEFQNRMDGVKQYMTFRRVGPELEARVIRWFAYTWAQSGALDEERVLAALPDKLKAEIAIRVHMDTLKQVRIFQDCEPGLLEALVLKLKLQVFSPGDYICRKGDVGKEMYIVKRGRLSVVADDGVTVLATLGAGSVFGEVSVLEIAGNRTGNRRTANVRSLGYSDLFCLAKRDLWETLGDYPEARASLTERGCQLLRKDGLLDEDVFANAQRAQDSLEGGVEKLENSVENLNIRFARLLAEYSASQAKLKQRISKLELEKSMDSADTGSDYDALLQAAHPRATRLYSMQSKRRKTRSPGSGSRRSKQNTL